MGFARLRALTHSHCCFPIKFCEFSRNGICPTEGIDTAPFEYLTSHRIEVEMGFARLRALTQKR